jgi:hypothetical protein
VLLDESLTPDERFTEQLSLLDVLSRIFSTDHVDLIVLNEASPLLAYEALRHGVLLYCADARTRIEFQVCTLRAYEDTIPLRRILSEAMVARLKAGSFGKPVLTKNRESSKPMALSNEVIGVPATSQEAIELLRDVGVFPATFADTLVQMARFRNLLVQIYAQVDIERVYDHLQSHLDDFGQCAQYVLQFLAQDECLVSFTAGGGLPLWLSFQVCMEDMASDHRDQARPDAWWTPFLRGGRTRLAERKGPWQSRSVVSQQTGRWSPGSSRYSKPASLLSL